MQFSYEITGRGWAEATITEGQQEARITVSYLTADALGDLLAAVTAALGPLGRGMCSWQEEPGEYDWSFQRAGEDIEVAIDWYAEWREVLSDQTHKRIYEASTRATEAGSAFAAGAERLLATHGEDGYNDAWGRDPFPTERLQRLREPRRRHVPDLAHLRRQTRTGKTSAHTDTHHGRFVQLVPNERVVEVDEFRDRGSSNAARTDPAPSLRRGRLRRVRKDHPALLSETGGGPVDHDLVSVAAEGFEAQADWANLESPETYLGYEQAQNFASPGGAGLDEPRIYDVPDPLKLNQRALSGDWTIERAKRAEPRGWWDRVPLPTEAASQTGPGLPVGEQSEQPAS